MIKFKISLCILFASLQAFSIVYANEHDEARDKQRDKYIKTTCILGDANINLESCIATAYVKYNKCNSDSSYAQSLAQGKCENDRVLEVKKAYIKAAPQRLEVLNKREKEEQKLKALKLCDYNVGQSIQCPEGTYKFIGAHMGETVNSIGKTLEKKIQDDKQPTSVETSGTVQK